MRVYPSDVVVSVGGGGGSGEHKKTETNGEWKGNIKEKVEKENEQDILGYIDDESTYTVPATHTI